MSKSNKNQASVFPSFNPNVQITKEDEISTERSERLPLNSTRSKYLVIWKRVKAKIFSQIRIEKILNAAKRLQINELTSKEESSINTIDIENYFEKRAKELTAKKPNKQSCYRPLKPESLYRKSWDTYLGIWIVYSCIVTPLTLAFIDNPSQGYLIVDIIIDFSFLSDVLLNFFTAYYDKDGMIHFDLLSISKNYLRSWFLLDLVAAFPFGLLEITTGDQSSIKGTYSSLARIVKLRNLFRLIKISRAIKFLKYSNNDSFMGYIQNILKLNYNTQRAVKTFFLVIISLHIYACFFYYTCKYDEFSPDCWVVRGGYQDYDRESIYLTSLYFSLVALLTVGFGDIVPKTQLEKGLVMLWMVVGTYFISFVISSLSSSLAQNDVRRAIIDQKYSLLDHYADETGIDKATKRIMQTEIKNKSIRTAYSTTLKSDLVQDLSAQTKYLIASKMYSGALAYFRFFTTKDKSFISAIFPLLESQYFEENEVIYSENDVSEQIYFIARGRVYFVIDESRKPFRVLNLGNYFGDNEIVRDSRRYFTVIAPNYSFALVMNKDLIFKMKEAFPKIWDEFCVDSIHREKNLIKSCAEMKILLKINDHGTIGFINPKEVKAEIALEIERINRELEMKKENIEDTELIRLIKAENAFTRDALSKLEKRMHRLEKRIKKKHHPKPPSEFPPIKK